jgi:hypothetical protein
MRILHICSHKRSLPSPAIFRPAIYGALRSRSVSHGESDPTTYAIENIGLIILKRPLNKATHQLQGESWSKAKRMLKDARALSHLDRLHEQLNLAVPEPMLREALTHLWYLSRWRRQSEGEDRVRFHELVILEQILCGRLCSDWYEGYMKVDELLSQAVRTSSAVEGVNSVVRMHQGRHRHVSQEMLDLKRLYWNCRVFREGKRKGRNPCELLGLKLPTSDWWQLLQMDPQELEQKLLTQ